MSQQEPQWGQRGNQGPPDLDEIFSKMIVRLKQMLGDNGAQRPPSGYGPRFTGGMSLLLLVLLVLWLSSGFYQVDTAEQGVVLRFGKYVESTDPGLRWRMPWPIERHEIVNLSQIRNVEVGYQTDSKARLLDESLMLTEDQNIIDLQLEVQYNIKNAQDFLFNNAFFDPAANSIVKQAAETAIREIVGRNKVDFVLNEGRTQIAADMTRLVQTLLDNYHSGINVVRVNINDVQAPQQVQSAFADAVKAGQDRVKQSNEGLAYANDVIPKARGTAARLLAEAEGYQKRVIAQAEGDTARFKKIATEYSKAPLVTRERLYFDTMQYVLSRSSKVLVDQKNGSNSLLYLPLDKLMQAHATEHSLQAEPMTEKSPSVKTNGGDSRTISSRFDRRGEREGR